MVDGRKRTPIPKGKDAEEELKRIKRNQRRKERRAAKKAAEEQQALKESEAEAPPVKGSVAPPTVEELKQNLMLAFNELGGYTGLVSWGRRYPKEFYALWAKYCLPEIKGGNDDDEGGAGVESLLMQLAKQREGETAQ